MSVSFLSVPVFSIARWSQVTDVVCSNSQGSKSGDAGLTTEEKLAKATATAEMAASRNEMVKAVCILLPRLLNAFHRIALVQSALSEVGHAELHRRLGPLYGPLFGNPTGC